MDIIQALTGELQVQRWQVEAAVELIDEGNTIPSRLCHLFHFNNRKKC